MTFCIAITDLNTGLTYSKVFVIDAKTLFPCRSLLRVIQLVNGLNMSLEGSMSQELPSWLELQ